jgi:transmembrane sensor
MDLKDKPDWQKWNSNQSEMSEGLMGKLWNASSNYKENYQPDVEAGFAAFQQRMGQESPSGNVVKMRPRPNYLLRIAAGLAILAIGVLVFKSQLGTSDKIQALVTPSDSTLQSKLPDGSNIELNRSSELSFQSEFAEKERRVNLKGEAFFQVQREENRPFIIETEVGQVQVLGTSFNVRDYPKEAIFEVYVASGKVQVTVEGTNQPIELEKGAFFRLDKSTNKAVKGVDVAGVPAAWHTGVLSFKGQPIPSILEGMERLYGVQFENTTNQKNDCLQTLTVQEGKLEEAIAAMKVSCPQLRFEEKSNGDYTVSGACCE